MFIDNSGFLVYVISIFFGLFVLFINLEFKKFLGYNFFCQLHELKYFCPICNQCKCVHFMFIMLTIWKYLNLINFIKILVFMGLNDFLISGSYPNLSHDDIFSCFLLKIL